MTRAPELATDRVILRGWREGDLAPMAEMNADPEVMRFLGPVLDRQGSDLIVGRFLQKWAEEPRFGWWAAEDRGSGAFLGFVGLNRPDFEEPPAPCVEIGWRLARAAWGRGLATEAARACLAHGFETVGLAEVVAFTVPENRRSRRVMERLGMARDPSGNFEHPLVPAGSPLRPHVLYRLTRRDWEDRRG